MRFSVESATEEESPGVVEATADAWDSMQLSFSSFSTCVVYMLDIMLQVKFYLSISFIFELPSPGRFPWI